MDNTRILQERGMVEYDRLTHSANLPCKYYVLRIRNWSFVVSFVTSILELRNFDQVKGENIGDDLSRFAPLL